MSRHRLVPQSHFASTDVDLSQHSHGAMGSTSRQKLGRIAIIVPAAARSSTMRAVPQAVTVLRRCAQCPHSTALRALRALPVFESISLSCFLQTVGSVGVHAPWGS
jgi:hypothetical protein